MAEVKKSKSDQSPQSGNRTASVAPKRKRWRIVIALALLWCAGLVGLDWVLLSPLSSAGETIIEVKPGEAIGAALSRYESQGLIDRSQRGVLLAWARVAVSARAIRAGEYRLPQSPNALDILQTLQTGKVVLRELRLIEGWTLRQALEEIARNPYVQHSLPDHPNAAAILEAVGASEPYAEGWFFPDTYRFAKGTSDVALLKEAYRAMKRHLNEAWAARDPNVSYTDPEQALIMASLVEKESAVDDERSLIAAVFLHRLRIGMRLQTDPSVIYGLGTRYDGNLHTRDLVGDTPYNTYTRDGLPPTPICLPGLSSLRAALHPADTQALYFVARGNGTHQFSDSLSEHNAAVRRFQLGHGSQ